MTTTIVGWVYGLKLDDAVVKKAEVATRGRQCAVSFRNYCLYEIETRNESKVVAVVVVKAQTAAVNGSRPLHSAGKTIELEKTCRLKCCCWREWCQCCLVVVEFFVLQS